MQRGSHTKHTHMKAINLNHDDLSVLDRQELIKICYLLDWNGSWEDDEEGQEPITKEECITAIKGMVNEDDAFNMYYFDGQLFSENNLTKETYNHSQNILYTNLDEALTNTSMTKMYKGFQIDIVKNGMQCLAYLNGEPMFGTFSHLDSLSAYEKMLVKIDNHLKK